MNKKQVIHNLKKNYPDEYDVVSSLSSTTKMPGLSYGLPIKACIVGSKLRQIKNSVCSKCYASRGNYLYDNVQNAQYKRLHSLNHPLWVPSMATLLRAAIQYGDEYRFFRFNDSGDIQGCWHLENIIKVAELCPNIKFWMPTKEISIISKYKEYIPRNLCVRLSAYLIDVIPQAKHWPTSTVTTQHKPVSSLSILCNAPNQDNQCKDCRKCWDKNVQDVSYHQH